MNPEEKAMELRELIAAREALEAEIAHARRQEIAGVIAEIKQKMSEYGISRDELNLAREKRQTARPAVAPKYRDPHTGKTWSGRGKAPKWIDGKNRDDYLIEPPQHG